MKRNRNQILLLSFVIILTIVGFAFLRIGIGFGNAVSKTAVGIYNAKEEWKQDSISPIDTIKKHLFENIDSTKVIEQNINK
ncbi:MAG: hypothetical protein P1U56_16915 [Saprospiraceae bacterium]|nr:hypothetical protein [Saprospiraceae bacterium]